jgi:hypothetical protein
MYPLLQPILNRGGAGRSMTREESVEALVPLVVEHQRLLLAYEAAIRTLGDRGLADRLNDGMNRARTELGKLRETIFSLGGDSPNGVGLDTDVHLGTTDAEIVHALDERERAYRDALARNLALPHHQLRSTAIIENNIKGTKARLDVLHPVVTRMRRPETRPGARPSQPARPVPVDETTDTPVDVAPEERHAREQPVIDIPPRS